MALLTTDCKLEYVAEVKLLFVNIFDKLVADVLFIKLTKDVFNVVVMMFTCNELVSYDT